MAKKKTKNRAMIRDLTAEYSILSASHAGKKPLDFTSIYKKVKGTTQLRWRNSKGQVTKPNKRSKIRYELVDKKTKKIIYKSDYKKYKRVPTTKQIIKTAGNYFHKGKGRAFQSLNLKEGKDKNTIDIEFETP